MSMVLVREPALEFGATEKFWIVFPTCEPAVIHESDRGAKVHVQDGGDGDTTIWPEPPATPKVTGDQDARSRHPETTLKADGIVIGCPNWKVTTRSRGPAWAPVRSNDT